MGSFIQMFCFIVFIVSSYVFSQNKTEGLKTAFDKFIAAQNAHDLKTLESLLSDSPNFLWITAGNVIWGRDEAMKRFAKIYGGTWHLEPKKSELRIVLEKDNVAQIFVPILFSIGQADQPIQETHFIMNQVWVREESGWKITSLLPIPVP